MNRRDALAALGAASLCPNAFAATPLDLRRDVAILREALHLHPGLYRYASPKEVERRIMIFEQQFVHAPTLDRQYLALSSFLATIRCGHSYANFFNQKKAVANALFDRPTRLPFQFKWINGRLIVTGDPGRCGLAPGSEIMSINGVPAPRMLSALQPYARADGHNDAKRVALLGVAGGDSIEYFDVFHGLVYGAPADGYHHLVVRQFDGASRSLIVPAIDLAARRRQMVQRDYNGSAPVWDWELRSDGIALLTMPSWALYNSKWDWRSWLDDRLDSLKGAAGLIIDLRDNEGGEDCGDAILARLIDQPLAVLGAERRVRFRRTPPALDPYLDTWDKSFRALGENAEPVDDRFFRLTGEMADDAIKPRGKPLGLKVAALIGPVNSSATFQFAAKARRTGRVRLFGETTGGNQRGINGGCFFFVRLPASGLEFDLPLIGYFPPGHPPDAGIAPDVMVASSPRDIATGFDRVADAASRWILA